MGNGVSTAERQLNLGTEVPWEGSLPLYAEAMIKFDRPGIAEPFRQGSTGQNLCAEVLRDLRVLSGFAWAWSSVILISTIPIGGHYAIDIIGGTMVWAACTLAVRVGTARHSVVVPVFNRLRKNPR